MLLEGFSRRYGVGGGACVVGDPLWGGCFPVKVESSRGITPEDSTLSDTSARERPSPGTAQHHDSLAPV
jgi:hypothetical protein